METCELGTRVRTACPRASVAVSAGRLGGWHPCDIGGRSKVARSEAGMWVASGQVWTSWTKKVTTQ